MRYRLVVIWMLFWWVSSATAQVSIGINFSSYPELVPVPGYPVYYAPGLNSNFFFYDGMYWVYQDDNWYASSWYNGPWGLVAPWYVPLFILRIPVGYYRYPPMYFREWRPDAPPHWGERWGEEWEHRRHGWDRWNRRSAPPPAPLPAYQREYSGDRYPRRQEQQRELNNQYYRYQPRDDLVRQRYQEQEHGGYDGREGSPQRPSRQRDTQRLDAPAQQPNAPAQRPPSQKGGEDFQRPAPAPPQQSEPAFQQQKQPQQRPTQRERKEQDVQRPAPPPPQQREPALQQPQTQQPQWQPPPQQRPLQRERREEAIQRPAPPPPSQRDVQRPAPPPPQQREPVVQPQQQRQPPQREQQMPRSNQEGGHGAPQDTRQGQGQEKDRARGDERDQDHYR